METTTTKGHTMTSETTLELGTTIHDETFAIHRTGRRWKLTLDGGTP